MASLLRGFLLLFATLPLLWAIPTGEFQSPLFHHSIGRCQPPAQTAFQRVRNSIIEKIWNIPSKPVCHHTGPVSGYAAPANFRTKYGGDVVLRFKIATEDEAKAFAEAVDTLYLDVWDVSSEWVDVRISKEILPSLLSLLPPSLQHAHTSLVPDLARAVYDTYPTSHHTQETWRVRHHPEHKHHHELFFTNYQPLPAIHSWLNLIANIFPQVAQSFSIGNSAEGRDIPAIRISAPLADQVPDDEVRARPAILVVGGSHAREWISTSTAAYMAYSLATRYGEPHQSTVTKLLRHYDIYFVPVLNPDGYEYTWGTDRLWRKNRQATALPFCPGIDLDRSFGYQWDGEDDKDNPCTDYYAGEFPFQAVESQVLVEWAMNKTAQDDVVFMTYLDLHSYSQKVLYPYSYSCDAEPASLENLEEIAWGLAKSFRLVTGRYYDVGSACHSSLLSSSSSGAGGSSLDYFYAMLRVRHAFQIKLRDTGTYGFLLPKEEIVPSGKEMFGALVNYGRWLLGNRGIEMVDDDDVDEIDDKVLTDLPSMVGNVNNDDVVDDDDDDDDGEWERVFDEELRRRRR